MPLRSLIFDHFWLKLFSVVLAALIWLAIRSNLANTESQIARRAVAEEPTRKFSRLPVLLLRDTSSHAPLLIEPALVEVSLRGPASFLADLRESNIQVFVRLTEGPTTGVFPVEVRAPNGVTVFQINPARVQVKPAALR